MLIEVRLLQEENAKSLIVLTLGGMVMDVRQEQPENAEPLIVLTLGGMVMDVRQEQPEYLLLVDYQCYTL